MVTHLSGRKPLKTVAQRNVSPAEERAEVLQDNLVSMATTMSKGTDRTRCRRSGNKTMGDTYQGCPGARGASSARYQQKKNYIIIILKY